MSSRIDALSVRLFALLSACKETLSTAESCTGGLLAKVMTDLPGSSAVFSGGFVTYTNDLKLRLLGVAPEVIDRDTEVSASCATAMAEGARERTGTTYALSTTGFAGPGGGNDRDPVGTVYIALAASEGAHVERFSAPDGASRTEVRLGAAERALEMLIKEIENGEWKQIDN